MFDCVPVAAALFALIVFYGVNRSRRLKREQRRQRMFNRQLTIVQGLRRPAQDKTEQL